MPSKEVRDRRKQHECSLLSFKGTNVMSGEGYVTGNFSLTTTKNRILPKFQELGRGHLFEDEFPVLVHTLISASRSPK